MYLAHFGPVEDNGGYSGLAAEHWILIDGARVQLPPAPCTASNLEQVASVLRLTQPPTLSGMGNE